MESRWPVPRAVVPRQGYAPPQATKPADWCQLVGGGAKAVGFLVAKPDTNWSATHLTTSFIGHLAVLPVVLSLPAGVISMVSSYFPLIAAHCR